MKRLLGFISAALMALFLMLTTLPAFAASTPQNSSGLSIEPRKNLVVNPGQTVNDRLTITNLSSTATLDLSLKVIDFTFTDDSGTPKLYLGNQAQTPWSLKPFIKLPSDLIVPAGATKSIDYSVTIPKNQGAGSYYSAIDYAAGGPNGNNVNLSASGVTLMFVSVPGIVHEDMSLQKLGAFQTPNGGVSGGYSYINTNEPEWLAYTLKNNGNVAESPTGNMTLKDMWGHTVLTVGNTNPNSSLAIIGQTRLFQTCMKNAPQTVNLNGQISQTTTCADPHLKPGLYKVNLDAFYGQNGNQTKELTGTGTFWYLPWWFIAVVIAIVLLIIGLIFWVRHKIRNHKSGKKSRR